MSIDPGAYRIRNVMHRNFAVQSGHIIESHSDRLHPTVEPTGTSLLKLWSISRLDNDKYTIRNIETNDYAACPNFSTIETNIITTEDLQEWDIKETGVKGRYVIYTTSADIDLFWGLTNGRRETQITLRDNPNTPSNQWELKDVSLWGVVGSLRANLADLREEQVGLQGEYAKLRGEHTELQDTHTKLQNEHMKLRDEYKKLQEHGKDPETKKLTCFCM